MNTETDIQGIYAAIVAEVNKLENAATNIRRDALKDIRQRVIDEVDPDVLDKNGRPVRDIMLGILDAYNDEQKNDRQAEEQTVSSVPVVDDEGNEMPAEELIVGEKDVDLPSTSWPVAWATFEAFYEREIKPYQGHMTPLELYALFLQQIPEAFKMSVGPDVIDPGERWERSERNWLILAIEGRRILIRFPHLLESFGLRGKDAKKAREMEGRQLEKWTQSANRKRKQLKRAQKR